MKGPCWRVPGPGSHVKVLGPGLHLQVPGPESQVKGLRWRVPGPGSHVWVLCLDSQVPDRSFAVCPICAILKM